MLVIKEILLFTLCILYIRRSEQVSNTKPKFQSENYWH